MGPETGDRRPERASTKLETGQNLTKFSAIVFSILSCLHPEFEMKDAFDFSGVVGEKLETEVEFKSIGSNMRMENSLGHNLLDETLSLGHSISSDGLLSVESTCDSDEEKDYLNAALSDGQSISSDDLLSEGSDFADEFSLPVIQDVPILAKLRSTGEGETSVQEVHVTESEDSPEDESDCMNFIFDELETIIEEGETDEEKEEFMRQKDMYFKLSAPFESTNHNSATKLLYKTIDNSEEDSHKFRSVVREFGIDKSENTFSYDAGDEYEAEEGALSIDTQNSPDAGDEYELNELTFSSYAQNHYKTCDENELDEPDFTINAQNGPLSLKSHSLQKDQANAVKEKCESNVDQILVDSSDRTEISHNRSENIVAQSQKVRNGIESTPELTSIAHDNNVLDTTMKGVRRSHSVAFNQLKTKENRCEEELEKRREAYEINLTKLELSGRDSCETDSRWKEHDNDCDMSYTLLHESSADDEISPTHNFDDNSHIRRSLSSLERQLEEGNDLYMDEKTQTNISKWGLLNMIWSSLYRLTSRDGVTSDTETTESLLSIRDEHCHHDGPASSSTDASPLIHDQTLSILSVSLFLIFLTLLLYFLFLP